VTKTCMWWLRNLRVWGPLAGVLFASCTGTPPHDARALAIARAPHDVVGLPLRATRPYWLLRQEPGWLGSAEARYGGGPADETQAFARVARFGDRAASVAAAGRLDPAYFYRLLRHRMTEPPLILRAVHRTSGSQVTMLGYRAGYLPDPASNLFGRLTIARAGTTVVVVESVGVPDEQLLAAIDAMLAEARGAATTASRAY
jgi:hypothetical protein